MIKDDSSGDDEPAKETKIQARLAKAQPVIHVDDNGYLGMYYYSLFIFSIL